MNLPKIHPKCRNLFLATALLASAVAPLSAQVPQMIHYQGRVTVTGTPFTGTGQFRFALVNADASTSYWSNDGTSTAGSEPTAAVSLPVVSGLYSVPLGDTTLPNMTAIPPQTFANPDVRLRVWFDNGTNGSELLAPDQRITSVGYAMVAGAVTSEAITTAMIAPGAVTTEKLAPEAGVPSGTVVAFAGATAPAGWALCNGQTLDGTLPQYANLFAALGLVHGGTGTNFKVPDLRGRSAIGAGQGSGLSNRLLAQKMGAETHTLTIPEMPAHAHTGTTNLDGDHSHTTSGNAADDDGGGPDTHFALGDSNAGRSWIGIGIGGGAHQHNFTTNSTGGNQPHNIMQPSLVLNYIIKL